jgi:hypothetical protein
MYLMEQIRRAGEELVLWCGGHNMLLGNGVQFLWDGPDNEATRRTARDFERLAEWTGTPLDLSDPEDASMRLHPGTVATHTAPNAAQMFKIDSSVRTGGSPFDWGRQFWPNMSTQITEVAMFVPQDYGPFEVHWTRQRAELTAKSLKSKLDEKLSYVARLARLLPSDDPDVSAVQAIFNPDGSWGSGSHKDPDDVLNPHEAYKVVGAGPMYFARNLGPALNMLRRHRGYLQDTQAVKVDKLIDELKQAATVISYHTSDIQPVEPWQPIALQIMAAEVAAHGAQGIHLKND